MCNLHWCYTFCTGVTLFALVLHLNCTALSQSESSNFFMYIITQVNKLQKISASIEAAGKCFKILHVRQSEIILEFPRKAISIIL